ARTCFAGPRLSVSNPSLLSGWATYAINSLPTPALLFGGIPTRAMRKAADLNGRSALQLPNEGPEIAQPLDERLKAPQRESVRPVGKRPLGIIMNFHKDAIRSRRDPRAGQGLNELGLATAPLSLSAGELERVGDIEENGNFKLLHDRQAPHVHDQVVVPETCAALRHQN